MTGDMSGGPGQPKLEGVIKVISIMKKLEGLIWAVVFFLAMLWILHLIAGGIVRTIENREKQQTEGINAGFIQKRIEMPF